MVEGLTSIPAPDQGSACREVGISKASLDLRSTGAGVACDVRRCRHLPDAYDPGDSSGEATPVPIPNTEVKLSSAEDTERAAFRENRSSPGLLHLRTSRLGGSAVRGCGACPAGSGRTANGGGILDTMTDNGEGPSERVGRVAPVPRDAPRASAGVVYLACPYLVAADATWRGSQPTRDHRCGATQPPAALAIAKQRDLCLTSTHVNCATFVAAQALDARRALDTQTSASGFWPETRSVMLALDPGHGRPASLGGSSRKGGGQALLVGLMVLAFLVLVIARTAPQSGPDAPQPGTGESPSVAGGGAAASAPPTIAPPTPSPPASGAPSASGGVSPSSSAGPPSSSPAPSTTPPASATPEPATSPTPPPRGPTRSGPVTR